jgi:hypothetical protein
MLKKSLSNRIKKPQQFTAVLIVLIVAIVGTYLLIGSHAATPYSSVTADSGTLAAGAAKQTCSGSSDGSCVVFGTVASTGGGGTNTTKTNCIVLPSACGYPDATNSGNLTPASQLTNETATINASTAGETIQDVNLVGGIIDVTANNVTIKDTTIHDGDGQLDGSTAIYIAAGVTGTTVEDTTMLGTGSTISTTNCGPDALMIGVTNSSNNDQLTMERDYSNCLDDILHGSGTIEDSYSIDNPDIPWGSTDASPGTDHYEPISDDGGDGGLTAIHNTLLNTHDQTAAIFTQCYAGNVSSLTIQNNLMEGGTYVVYGPLSDSCSDGGGTEVVTGNRFARSIDGGKGLLPNGGTYNLGVYFNNSVNWSGNYWDDSPSVFIDQDGNPT